MPQKRLTPPSLYIISDRKLCSSLPEVFAEIAKEAPRGSVAFQVREKELSAGALHRLTAEVVERVSPLGALVFVNDRADVAVSAGASGVHLSGRSMSAKDALPLGLLLATSTHNLQQINEAEGSLFCTFGPVYDTPSKRVFGAPVGEEALRGCASLGVPLYALGGITKERVARVLASGAAGIAVISTVLAQRSPVKSALELLEEVSRYYSGSGFLAPWDGAS